MKQGRLCSALAVGGLLLAAPGFGQVLNGTFNGNLNNWNVSGYAAAVGTEGAVVPISSAFQALIASGDESDCPVNAAVRAKGAARQANIASKHQLLVRPGAQRLRPTYSCGGTSVADVDEATLETFLSLPSGSINTALPDLDGATAGSAIFQQFTVTTAPTTLSFYWNMTTNEDIPSQYDAALFAFQTGANPAQVTKLADTELSAFSPDTGSADFASTTGYHVVNIPITTNGTYSIGFISMQTGDDEVSSGTYISNVQLGAAQAPPATPIPASWYLVLIGIAFMAFYLGWQGRLANRA